MPDGDGRRPRHSRDSGLAKGRRLLLGAGGHARAVNDLPCTTNVSVKSKRTFTYVNAWSDYLTQRVSNTELKEPRHV